MPYRHAQPRCGRVAPELRRSAPHRHRRSGGAGDGVEIAGARALKAGDHQAFANLIADEAIFLDPRGHGTKAEVVEHTSDFRLLDYTMENIKFVAAGSNSGVVAYKLTQTGNAHGHEFTSVAYASALWTKRDGKWVCLFSQETPARM